MTKRLAIKTQVTFIRKQLERKGVEPDTVDVEALVDPELSYRENLKNVLEQSGIAAGKAGSKESEVLKNPACTEAGTIADPHIESKSFIDEFLDDWMG